MKIGWRAAAEIFCVVAAASFAGFVAAKVWNDFDAQRQPLTMKAADARKCADDPLVPSPALNQAGSVFFIKCVQ